MIREERKWIQVVSDVEARADNRVNEALSSVLESEVKTQRLVKAAEHSSKRKIAKISRRANKTIDKLQTDCATLQNQCDQMKSTHAADLATLKIKYTSVIKDQQSELLLDHLYVIPSAQGAGIGSEVLTRIFREADEIGRPIKVGALKESASNRFYTRHGFVFVESGEFDNYYVRASGNALNLGD